MFYVGRLKHGASTLCGPVPGEMPVSPVANKMARGRGPLRLCNSYEPITSGKDMCGLKFGHVYWPVLRRNIWMFAGHGKLLGMCRIEKQRGNLRRILISLLGMMWVCLKNGKYTAQMAIFNGQVMT